MDCMTISTYRNLEQQAIRQYKESKINENRYKSISKETFGQEHVVSKKLTNDSKTETTTNRGKLNYYA